MSAKKKHLTINSHSQPYQARVLVCMQDMLRGLILREKYLNMNCLLTRMTTETMTLPMEEYNSMVAELETLRRTDLYQRLLSFMQNIQHKKFTRADLGF